MSFLCTDHFAGQDQLKSPAFTDQSRQTLRSAAARDESQTDFGLSELGGLDRNPDRASHRGFAAAAEREAIDSGDDRLAEVFDQVEDLLPEAARLLGLNRADMRELANIGTGDECLVSSSREDDAAHHRVVARVLEGRPEIGPGWGVKGVEDLRAIDGDVGNAAFLFISDV